MICIIINRWTEAPITISNKGDLLLTCKGTIGSMAFNDIGQIHIARQVISRSTLLGMLFPLPPFKEQQRIVAQIEKLFEQLR